MALFYFHVADGETILDEVGADLPDGESVRHEAVRVSSELLNTGRAAHIWHGKPWKVWVTRRAHPCHHRNCGLMAGMNN
jgi:hypothetical protein